MSKPVYGIPKTLDSSFMDIEIAVQSSDGIGLKAVPLKAILVGITSILLIMFTLFRTFVGQGGFIVVVLFCIAWIAMTMLLVKFDKSRRMGIELVPVMLGYLPKSSRRVVTKKTSDLHAFMSVLGIEVIEGDGRILFADGGCGYAYSIVGSASTMLFEADRDAILERYDNYFRKADPDVEHIFVTAKEAQRVHNQVAALENRFARLDRPCRDLAAIVEQQRDTLKNYVGGRFQSLHQYLILRAKNKEVLQMAVAALVTEVGSSSMVFRHCAALTRDQILDLLRSVYGPYYGAHN